jgi:delta24-sterol reductase
MYASQYIGYIGTGLGLFYFAGMLVYRGWFEQRSASAAVAPPLGFPAHSDKVAVVRAQLAAWLASRAPGALLSVRRSSPSSNRTLAPLAGSPPPAVDVGPLCGVISYDAASAVLHVEPGLPQDALARFCLARGLCPPVVLEFPGITVGGAFSGGGIESSSVHHGSFADTVEEVDVLLGDGRFLQRVSRARHADLFFALRNSYGTVGILTRLAIAGVRPSPPLVHLRFEVCAGAAAACAAMEAAASAAEPPQFMDAVALSAERAVVVLASAVAAPPPGAAPLCLRASRFAPWFAWHLENVAAGRAPREAVATLEDYLFRFDRGAFWMARHGLGVFFGAAAHAAAPAGGAPAPAGYDAGPAAPLRFLYAWLATTRQLYAMLHRVGDTALAKTYIVQDFILPSAAAAAAFVERGSAPLGVWPLWLCPVRHLPARAAHAASAGFGFPEGGGGGGGGLLFNVGVYGAPSPALPRGRAFHASGAGAVAANRGLEGAATALGGRKMLYAQSFYSEGEFWALFKRRAYDAARREYGAEGVFPSIDRKVLLGEARLRAVEASGAATVFSLANVGAMAVWYLTLWGELLLPRALHALCGISHTGMEAMGAVEGAEGRG